MGTRHARFALKMPNRLRKNVRKTLWGIFWTHAVFVVVVVVVVVVEWIDSLVMSITLLLSERHRMYPWLSSLHCCFGSTRRHGITLRYQ